MCVCVFSCSQIATAGRRCCCLGGPEVRGTTATHPGWSTPEATAERNRRVSDLYCKAAIYNTSSIYSTSMEKHRTDLGSTHVQRRFWDIRRPAEAERAVALETGILVASLHHLVAATQLGVTVETL